MPTQRDTDTVRHIDTDRQASSRITSIHQRVLHAAAICLVALNLEVTAWALVADNGACDEAQRRELDGCVELVALCRARAHKQICVALWEVDQRGADCWGNDVLDVCGACRCHPHLKHALPVEALDRIMAAASAMCVCLCETTEIREKKKEKPLLRQTSRW